MTPAEAAAEYKKLEGALTGRTTDHATCQKGSVAVDAEELKVCVGLHRAHTGLLHERFENPEMAYAFLSFPQITGTPADANLPSLSPPQGKRIKTLC